MDEGIVIFFLLITNKLQLFLQKSFANKTELRHLQPVNTH